MPGRRQPCTPESGHRLTGGMGTASGGCAVHTAQLGSQREYRSWSMRRYRRRANLHGQHYLHVFRGQTHEQDYCLCLLVQLVVFQVKEPVWDNVQCRANGDVFCLNGRSSDVSYQTGASIPHGVTHALHTEVLCWIIGLITRIVQVPEHCDCWEWCNGK